MEVHMFGRIQDFKRDKNIVNILFETGEGKVEIITDKIINIFSSLESKEHNSQAVIGNKVIDSDFDVIREKETIVIITREVIIKVHDEFKVDFYNSNYELLCSDYKGQRVVSKQPDQAAVNLGAMEGHAAVSNKATHKIEVIKTLEGDEAFYGLGDKTGFLNKRGYEYEMWNSDLARPQVDSFKSLYKSIPFFITRKKEHVFGIFFDNHYRTVFNMGKESDDYYYFGADDGNLDYYFIAGISIPEIVEGYTYLTGTTPLPQMWTLGYHQSRWSYETEEEVLEIAQQFRSLDLPCDSIHLDIDYMSDYKVFTWNRDRFPDPKTLLHRLSREGFKIVAIIDPGVKVEKGYSVYDEGMENGYFVTDKEGQVYENVVWPGPSVFPDFSDERVRKWWGNLQTILIDNGVRGLWNDMNEPASFRGELPEDVQFSDEGRGANHKKMHNVYGHLMAKATFDGLLQKDKDRRPFVITRACYSGSQKYATTWTGDNHSIWAHLQMAIPQLCNLGISGVTFAGTDVGGFGSDCTPELLSRWVQVGCFSPLFRNHCCKMNRRQEPWTYNEETLRINRKYIKLRYRLLPYLYDLFWESKDNGMPVMRPLVMHYEQDEKVREINDQFLFGSNILVAPVVNQGQRNRSVYLPEGTWVDYWTKETITGGVHILREAPLDLCPIYIKAGSIIPNYPAMNYIGEKEIHELILDLYEGEGHYHHFQDNGENSDYQNGIYNEYQIKLSKENELEITLVHNGYEAVYHSFKIVWKGQERIIPYHGNEIRISL
jgi:alpha-glucosidase